MRSVQGPRRGGRALLLQLGRLREPEDLPGVHEGDRHDRQKEFFVSNEALQAKLKAGAPGYDLAAPTGYMVKILAADDLLTPINWSKLPNVRRNIDPKFRKLPFDPQDRYSVARTGARRGSSTAPTRSRNGRSRGSSSSRCSRSIRGSSRCSTAARGHRLDRGDDGLLVQHRRRGQLNKVKDFLLPLKPNVLALDSVTYKQKIAGGKAFLARVERRRVRRREDEGRRSTSSPPKAASSGSTRT